MFKKTDKLDVYGEVREQRKILPYTVTNSDKGDAAKYNAEVGMRSQDRTVERRLNAINAFDHGMGDWREVKDSGSNTPKLRFINAVKTLMNDSKSYNPKTPIITRIYNWFLNINY